MTTGTEIVDEFHRNTFFYQSMADEWLAKRIDDAIRSAIRSAVEDTRALDMADTSTPSQALITTANPGTEITRLPDAGKLAKKLKARK